MIEHASESPEQADQTPHEEHLGVVDRLLQSLRKAETTLQEFITPNHTDRFTEPEQEREVVDVPSDPHLRVLDQNGKRVKNGMITHHSEASHEMTEIEELESR